MKKKIKIVFFIYYLGSGGAGRTFLNILNHLDREKFEPILVTCNYDGSYEQYLNSDIKFLKLPTKRLRKSIIPLARIIRKERPDIVFSTIPNYNVIAILAKLLSFTRAKNIVREAALLGGDRKTDIKLRVYGFFYKFAFRTIALSKGVKENLIKKYRVNSKKLRVIYNPIDLDYIENKMLNEGIPSDYKDLFRDDVNVIVTAGRLVEDKDQETLIKAFSIVKKKQKVRLLILGDGPLENKLKKLASELEIMNDIHFIGFQDNPYVFFYNADVFALTSKKEGFGHVIAEALATGTPVVSTNSKPGAKEILFDGSYEYLTTVGNEEEFAAALDKVLSLSEKERESLINRGKKRVKNFDVKSIVKEYESVFSESDT